jgi:hypothetical protein
MSKIYVKNDDKMIYEVEYKRLVDSTQLCHLYSLTLIAGYDYINPDENDVQGYVKADRFIDDVQYYNITVYPLDETLKDSLENEGYEIIDKLPRIY